MLRALCHSSVIMHLLTCGGIVALFRRMHSGT